MLQRTDFRFLDPLRVRWAEIDAQQIVFNGHYLMYFDTAVAGYWRALALPYHDTMVALQGDLYVRKATLEYEASARYDDQLQVGVRTARIGTSSLLLQAAVFRGAQRLVHGELVYVFADPATQKSRPIPDALRQLFDAFESGGDVVTAAVGSWAELGGDVLPLRAKVFGDELGVPAAAAADANDTTSVHAVLRNHFGRTVATGRLLPSSDGTPARIGRVATLAALRGAGLGRRAIQALLAAARERGERAVVLDAQSDAAGFYERLGFARHGAEFVEAGLPHVEMRLAL